MFMVTLNVFNYNMYLYILTYAVDDINLFISDVYLFNHFIYNSLPELYDLIPRDWIVIGRGASWPCDWLLT